MRPKKSILLYCADQELLSTILFALQLHPYHVVAVRDSVEASRLASDREAAFVCGVLVHAQQADPAGRIIHRLLECGSQIPVLLVDRAGDLAPVRYADMVLYGRNTTMAHILAGIQVLSQHRPGPKSRRVA
ncbi:hypothetical protein [Granulicella sp. L60]|uniref:hypothetical protein n=1 Tax=Granulicella sp. L60 TaxID=1641866 RepID=UPI00131C7BFA|nr:hypothetical protein [Granulicella sp. L60]